MHDLLCRKACSLAMYVYRGKRSCACKVRFGKFCPLFGPYCLKSSLSNAFFIANNIITRIMRVCMTFLPFCMTQMFELNDLCVCP